MKSSFNRFLGSRNFFFPFCFWSLVSFRYWTLFSPGPGSQEKSFSFLETVETAFPYSVIESDKVPSSIVLVCMSFLLCMGGMEIRLENHGPKTSPLRSLGWRIFLWFSCWKCFPASIPSSPTAFHSLFFYGSWRVNGKSITIGVFPLSLLYWSIR